MNWLAYRIFFASKWWIEWNLGVRVAVRNVELICPRCKKPKLLWVYPLDCCGVCYLRTI
jgi:hypothetical protein